MSLTEPAFWVLTALAETPRHGYAVLRRVAELTDDATTLRATTLYATLERLERDGLARTLSQEVVDGRARRTYALTDDGRQVLARETERLLARVRTATASLRRTEPTWAPEAGWATS